MTKEYHVWSVKDLVWQQLSGIRREQIGIVFLIGLLVFIPGIIRIIKKKSTIKDVFLAYGIFVWAGIMILITILRRQPGYAKENVNPFPTWESFGGSEFKTAYSFLNVLLFVPYGILLRLYNHRKPAGRAFLTTILVCLATTSAIEVTQLITSMGYFEFTDIINNSVGGLIGTIIGAILIKRASEDGKL